MSLYQFFASNKKLEEYDNGIITKRGENQIIVYNNEWYAMRIIQEEDLTYANMYTTKCECAYIEWHYNNTNAGIIIDYIKQHLQTSNEIELWNTWIGEKQKFSIKKVSIEELTINDIKDIWGKKNFKKPECLIIKKIK